MTKKGYALIEIIVVVLVLATSLLALYTSFKNFFVSEKGRLYYDDPVYIYRSYFYTDQLLNTNIKDNLFTDNFIYNVDIENDIIKSLENLYHINSVYIFKSDFDLLKKCKGNNVCINNDCNACNIYNNLEIELKNYLKTLKSFNNNHYYIIINYKENKDGSICSEEYCINNYVWLDMGVDYE